MRLALILVLLAVILMLSSSSGLPASRFLLHLLLHLLFILVASS